VKKIPYSQLLITLVIIAQVAIFPAEAAEKPELALQIGHSASVATCVFSPDGSLLATGGMDCTIRVWEISTGKILYVLRGHPYPVTALAFSPDSGTLASLSSNGTLNIWDMSSGKRKDRIEKVGVCFLPRLSFSPDGRVLAIMAGGHSILLRDMAAGKVARQIPLNDLIMTGLGIAWSPDGAILAVAGPACEERISLWDWKSEKKLRSFSCAPDRVKATPSLAYSPDGKVLVCGCDVNVADGKESGELILFDATTGKELKRLPGAEKGIQFLSFSPDSSMLACSFVNLINTPSDAKAELPESSGLNGYLKIWDVRTGTIIATEKDEKTGPLAFSPDGKTLAVAKFNEIELWPIDARGGTSPAAGERKIAFGKIRRLSGLQRNIGTVTFSPDRQILAFDLFTPQGRPCEIILWDTGAGTIMSTLQRKEYQGGLSFMQGGGAIAFSNKDCSQSMIEVPSGKEIGRLALLKQGDGSYPLVAFSPRGSLLALAAADNAIKIWDLAKKKELLKLKGHSAEINSIAFNSEGTMLASGSNDKTIRLWDVASGKMIRSWGGFESSVGKASFSADGKTLAATSTCASRDAKGEAEAWRSIVKVFDAGSGRARAALVGDPHDEIQTLAVSPDGALMAAGSIASTVTLWDASSGKERCRLRGLTMWAKSLSFSPDGKIIAGSSEHNLLKFWSVATGKQIATIVSTGGRDWVAVTPEGFFDGTPQGIAHIDWRIGRSLWPLESFFNEFYQPGLMKDILAKQMSIPDILKERGDGRATLDIASKDRRLPQLTLEAPPFTSSRTVRVSVGLKEAPTDAEHTARGSGVKDVRLFLDGIMVRKWAGEQKSGTTLSCEIPVKAGENLISAYAFNRDNIKSKDVECKVQGAPSLKRQGQAYILSIGINAYSLRGFSLDCAVKDAEELADSLMKNLPFPREAIHVTRLTDTRATRGGILKELRGIEAKAGPEDTVIITYAGHGITFEHSFYLVPCDLGTKEEITLKELAAMSIGDNELERIIAGGGEDPGLQAKHIALILDACHAGQVLEADEWRVGPMNSRGLAQLAWEKGMEVLTASQSDQLAKELKSLGHGLLTYALLEGFNKAPREGTLLECPLWFDFAAREVPNVSRGSGTRGLVPLTARPQKSAINAQVPRVFHRRQGGEKWIVSESKH
jgi:WD40 repeat protein